MDYLKVLLDTILTSDDVALGKSVYKSEIANDNSEIKDGKFSLIYSRNLEESYGMCFIDSSLLHVWHFPTNQYILKARYNEETNAWSIIHPNAYTEILLSEVVLLAHKLKSLL